MRTIYGIPNRDTMKKVFTWPDAHIIAPPFHICKEKGTDKATIKGRFAHFFCAGRLKEYLRQP